MEPLKELLAIDHRRALEFFFAGLRDVSEGDVDGQELLYNASVLAHYAQVSTASGVDLPAPATLTDVFDNFVCGQVLFHDGEMMETAGAQCLLLAGFFESQMRGRHNIGWYARLGAGYFSRAADRADEGPKTEILEKMARRFDEWRRRQARLGRELRDQAYLLTSVQRPRATDLSPLDSGD